MCYKSFKDTCEQAFCFDCWSWKMHLLHSLSLIFCIKTESWKRLFQKKMLLYYISDTFLMEYHQFYHIKYIKHYSLPWRKYDVEGLPLCDNRSSLSHYEYEYRQTVSMLDRNGLSENTKCTFPCSFLEYKVSCDLVDILTIFLSMSTCYRWQRTLRCIQKRS